MTGPRNYGESLNLDILQIHPVSVQSNTKKKGTHLYGTLVLNVLRYCTRLYCFSCCRFSLLILSFVWRTVRSMESHVSSTPTHTMCLFIPPPPIIISLIYLVCTNFPGIGRNQKERKNIHRLHASMAWRGNWHSWIHARGIM